MASPPPSRSAEQDDAPDPAGLPPTERLGTDPDPWTVDASLETRSLDPDPRNTSHSNLPAEPIGEAQIGRLKLQTTSLGVGPRQEPDTQSETNVARTPQTPVLGPGGAPGWRKRVINVKNKIGSTRLKQPPSSAPTSQKPGPEASRPDSSKLAHDGGQARRKAAEAGKIETAKGEANPRELSKLVDLSNLPPSLVPTSTIIAIPDMGLPLPMAWAYTLDKAYARRAGVSSKQPPASTHTTPGPIQTGRQGPPKGPAYFRAGLKALEEVKREGHARGDIQGWTDTIDSKAPEQPPATLPDESTATPMYKGKRRDDSGDIPVPEDVERGRRPLTPQLGVSAAEETISKKADADDRTSRHSNRPSSARGSKPPSERDRGGKAGNWLTDRTMLPHDVHRSQVWGFEYKSLDPTQYGDNTPKKKPDYEKYLHETADALLSSIIRRTRGPDPLIFIATGFGCLIVEKLVALARADADWILPISGVLFFDPPTPILKEKPKTEKVKAAPVSTAPIPPAPVPIRPVPTPPVSTSLPPTFPAPPNFGRANRLRAVLESKGIDSWDLWEGFHSVVKERELPVVWFYNHAQLLNRNVGAHSPLSPHPL